MSLLTDQELIRLAGLELSAGSRVSPYYAGQCERAVRGLRRAADVVPKVPPTVPPTPEWLGFITAVVVALSNGSDMPHSFVEGGLALRVASQLANLALDVSVGPDAFDRLLDIAAELHWLEAENTGSDMAAYRATLLGERMARGAGKLRPPTSSERFKSFRTLLLRYVTIARSNQVETIRRATVLHHELQDAWVELTDLTRGIEDYRMNAIVNVVECRNLQSGRWDGHLEEDATEQLDRLIVATAQAERLARLSTMGSQEIISSNDLDIAVQEIRDPEPVIDQQLSDPLSRSSTSAEGQIAGDGETMSPNSNDQLNVLPIDGEIQYITRDAAAALCGVTKGTLERWFSDDLDAPDPICPGGGGKRHEYDYRTLRPWLLRHSARQLPTSYDAGAIRSN